MLPTVDPHPASRFAEDPDGILLKYGPYAVMEHYWVNIHGVAYMRVRARLEEEYDALVAAARARGEEVPEI